MVLGNTLWWQMQHGPGIPGRVLYGSCYKHKKLLGNDLLSQEATPQVPSALTSLTAGFEMGPGVASSLLSPKSSNLSYLQISKSQIDCLAHLLICDLSFAIPANLLSRNLFLEKRQSLPIK